MKDESMMDTHMHITKHGVIMLALIHFLIAMKFLIVKLTMVPLRSMFSRFSIFSTSLRQANVLQEQNLRQAKSKIKHNKKKQQTQRNDK